MAAKKKSAQKAPAKRKATAKRASAKRAKGAKRTPVMRRGAPGGAISVRPWGERSFYAQDKWDNPLCFVEAGTVYSG